LQKDDILVCSEMSRLGRNLPVVVSVLRACVERGVRVWSVKDNYRLVFANGLFLIRLLYYEYAEIHSRT
jgi:DNA invertase Pin-like site-specific DNA recombinase